MHSCFQDILATCDRHQELRYEGTQAANHWGNGVLKTLDGKVYAEVQGGVPLFVPSDQDPWGDDEALAKSFEEDQVCRETLIPTNWRNAVTAWQKAKDRSWIERVVAHGGLTLIVACGPAGSHAPAILDLNPETKLLMNDIGKWVVQDWQQFADKKGTWPYLSFAQFDARRFPIRSDCLDCIDSSGAMSEIDDSSLTMQEAFRVLKPGGKLFLSEGTVDPACIREFPEEGRRKLYDHGFGKDDRGYKERLLSMGFDVVSYHQSDPMTPDLGRSTLADIAAKYGVQIRTVGVTVEAQKPPGTSGR